MSQGRTTPSLRAQRLWGLEPQKAPREGLTVEKVVQAAIAVADAEGLGAVSMSRVAKELGFTTMSLYRHVDSKDELLELMLDAAAAEPPEKLGAPGDWRAGLTAWTWAMLDLLRQRPWVVELPITGIPSGPGQLAWVEAGLRALRDTALTDLERFSVVQLLATHVRGQAAITAQLGGAMARAGREWHEAEQEWARDLAAVLDPERFPELSKLMASGALAPTPSAEDYDPDAEFRFGLDRILDGVEALIRRRGGTAPAGT
jgi:AcrR family transcriptional regulator